MSFHRAFSGTVLFVAVMVLLGGCVGQSDVFPLASEAVLPAFLSNAPPRVREAYQFAVANPHELEKYPCYCGCVFMGHTDNLDCYVSAFDEAGKVVSFDNHAVGCVICVDITQDVMRLMREGRSAPEIRTYIDAQYSAIGPSTDTPFPTE